VVLINSHVGNVSIAAMFLLELGESFKERTNHKLIIIFMTSIKNIIPAKSVFILTVNYIFSTFEIDTSLPFQYIYALL
jgi:hypothetical protein